jgi:hypothetical protein
MRNRTGDDKDPLDRCYSPRNLARAIVSRTCERGYLPPGARAMDAGAGDGAFYTAVQAAGRPCFGVDLDPLALSIQTCLNVWHQDFLTVRAHFDLVIGNPPFVLAEEFVLHGLTIAPVVAFLLPQLFLGSGSRFESGFWRPLAHVDPLVERAGFYGPALESDKQHKTGMVQHCLFIFTRAHAVTGGDFTSRHLPWGGMGPWRAERPQLVLDDRFAPAKASKP